LEVKTNALSEERKEEMEMRAQNAVFHEQRAIYKHDGLLRIKLPEEAMTVSEQCIHDQTLPKVINAGVKLC